MVPLSAWLSSGSIMGTPEGTLLLGWGARTWSKGELCPGLPQWYFPDFFLGDLSPWFRQFHSTEISLPDLLEQMHEKISLSSLESRLVPFHWQEPDPSSFAEVVEGVLSSISRGSLVKAVPYAFFRAHSPMDRERLERSLISLLTHCLEYGVVPYGFWGMGRGMIGGSPELLAYLPSQNHLQTVALAGTLPTGGEDAFGEKEEREQQVVVDDLLEQLSRHGQVVATSRKKRDLGSLVHLLTEVKVDLSSPLSLEQAVRLLHPTPALGGVPREIALTWLRQWERQQPRHRYGAPVGCRYLLEGEGERSVAYVAIRNVQWDRLGIKVGVGCGIIKGSSPEVEWEELQVKWQAIRKMLYL